MPRKKGTRVYICECGAQGVGFPGDKQICSFCGASNSVPKKEEKEKDQCALPSE